MSDETLARRADVQIIFKGSEHIITMNEDWISFSYTDNEEDNADDIQLKTHDRDLTWMKKYLSSYIDEQAEAGEMITTPEQAEAASGRTTSGSSGNAKLVYKVTSPQGLNVRTGAGEKNKIIGKLAYGDYVEVNRFGDGWANITYTGKTGYVKGETLKPVGSGSSESTKADNSPSTYSAGGTTSEEWRVGDAVIVSGRPYGSSYGEGKQGILVTDHKGKVTYLNLKAGVPYPICVDYLGWFAVENVRKADEASEISSGTQNNSAVVSKGVKLSAAIVLKNDKGDGKDTVLDCGLFELDSIDLQGPPTSLTIKGTSLSYSSAIRQTLKSKSWENTTLSEISNAIANANGMAVMFESKNNPKYIRAEQYKMSDISFLQKLCHDAGCSLKATNNILVIFDQAEFENKEAVRTIKFGEKGGYTKYKLSTAENNCYTSCRVYYTTNSGKVISATEYSERYREGDENQQCLEVRQKVSSIAEAQELAHKFLRLHNKYENEVSFTFPGDPTLVAGIGINLEGSGHWDGKYIVKQAKHTVSQSGYTTQITLRKALKENERAVSNGEETAENWNIGDEVIVSGRPQISSYGGSPGWEVKNHKGKITHLNLKGGIPFPIHVDYLGWFAIDQVRKA